MRAALWTVRALLLAFGCVAPARGCSNRERTDEARARPLAPRAVIGDGVLRSVVRRVEQEEEAVRAVDLAAAVKLAKHLVDQGNDGLVLNGTTVEGIDDHTCAGCHQGSNRTVLQYWGIRLDQNSDVRNHRQYPANPVSYLRTTNDTRLYDPAVGNTTFNGRNPKTGEKVQVPRKFVPHFKAGKELRERVDQVE